MGEGNADEGSSGHHLKNHPSMFGLILGLESILAGLTFSAGRTEAEPENDDQADSNGLSEAFFVRHDAYDRLLSPEVFFRKSGPTPRNTQEPERLPKTTTA
jgi:hypothetical protein